MDAENRHGLPDDIALNPLFRENERALLHALLQATDYGILLSGLDRQDIIANRRLGELFQLVPQDIVETTPDAVREKVLPRVRDPEVFARLLDRIYTDPLLTQEDEIDLAADPPRTLRRFTGPVVDGPAHPIGRLWTFLDITETKRLQAEVQAQLDARTREFHETSDVLRVMNTLCGLALRYHETEPLLTAIAETTLSLGFSSGVAVLLIGPGDQAVSGIAVDCDGPPQTISIPLKRDGVVSDVVRKALLGSRDLRLFPGHHGVLARKLRTDCLVAAQLRANDTLTGVLVLGMKETRTCLSPHEAAHLQAVADQIALTLATHQLQTEIRAATQTMKATQRRLVEAEKLRLSGILASGIAHDIRNILTTLQMELADLSLDEGKPVTAQVMRFSALTHRLLAFARPNYLEMRPTSVPDVFQRVIPLIEAQAEVSGVRIDVACPADLPVISADSHQLDHLLVNLCINAIQAMSARGGTLSLACRALPHWMEIRVADTGAGIAREILDRLFDPFFTTRETGFGLGLFSCKRIVEEHGGQITVQSDPGAGTKFTVLLPIPETP